MPSNAERPGDIVEVEWVDSTGASHWQSKADVEKLLEQLECRSVGYLIHDEPHAIVIALGTGGTGDYLDSMAIPRAAIVNLTRLTPSKKVTSERPFDVTRPNR